MANTTNLILPLMSASQSQKHLTHNDAIIKLDALVQMSVISAALTAPPGTPLEGDRYLIASGATGAWVGKDLNIVLYASGAWNFLPPRLGWMTYNQATGGILVWTGANWTDLATAGGFVSTSNPVTFTDNLITFQDEIDNTKKAQFQLSGIATGQTRVLTFPNVSGVLAVLNATQAFAGVTTFSNTFTVSAATATLGSGTAAATIGVGSGATLTGVSKTVNLGTSGVSGSTTTVNIGPAVAGALGTLNIDLPSVVFGSTVATIAGSTVNASFQYLGLGGATANATNRLSVNTPGALFNNAGAGVNVSVSKNAAANDASFTFQTAFSTRALFGLLGDDHFSMKVSANGSTFFTGINIQNSTGNVGVGGATADSNNGLSVSGNLLLNRSSTNILATLNKQSAANDAGFVFQTNFSTRAMFGILGSDNFSLKTSTNGSTFYDAMIFSASNGSVGFGNTPTGTDDVQIYGTGTLSLTHATLPQVKFIRTTGGTTGFIGMTYATGLNQVLTNPSGAVNAFYEFEPASGSGATVSYFRYSTAAVCYFNVSYGDNTGKTSARLSGGIADSFLNVQGGNLLVGTSSPGSFKLTLAGSFGPSVTGTHDIGSTTLRINNIFLANAPNVSSDIRSKFDILPSDLGLSFINKLQPSSYSILEGKVITSHVETEIPGEAFDTGKIDENGNPIIEENLHLGQQEIVSETRPGTRRHYGLIAQQVKATLDEVGCSDFAGFVLEDPTNPESLHSLRYEQFIAPLIKAVQELTARVEELENLSS